MHSKSQEILQTHKLGNVSKHVLEPRGACSGMLLKIGFTKAVMAVLLVIDEKQHISQGITQSSRYFEMQMSSICSQMFFVIIFRTEK